MTKRNPYAKQLSDRCFHQRIVSVTRRAILDRVHRKEAEKERYER